MEQEIRELPHDDIAEQSVLGALMFNMDKYSEVFEIIRDPKMFYHEGHQLVYSVLLDMYVNSKNADTLTVWQELERLGVTKHIGGYDYLSAISGHSSSLIYREEHAKIIVNLYNLRQIVSATETIKEKCFSKADSNEIFDLAQQTFFELQESNQKKSLQHVSEPAKEVFTTITQLRNNPNLGLGIKTNFYDLDRKTNGLKPSELIILAARPSMGKTAFALNICLNAAMTQGKRVAIFSLEMADRSITTRMAASVGLIDMEKINKPELFTDDELKQLYNAIRKISESNIYIDDSGGVTTSEIRSKCQKLKNSSKGLDLIMIDYIQLINSAGKIENRQQEVSAISRQLKQIARDLDVPVLALSQLSRASDSRPDKRPVLSDLRESGAIEQDADLCMFIYREEYYKKEETPEENVGIAEIIIAKQRNGETGTVRLAWNGAFQRFSNISNLEPPI